jgi:hypothetical protein
MDVVVLLDRIDSDTTKYGNFSAYYFIDRYNKPNPDREFGDAEAHVRSAHQILKALQEKIIGEHPEIDAAITKLEMALNDLAIQTGGRL